MSLGQSDPRPIRAGIRSMRLADPAPFEVIDGVRVATPIDILLACARDLRLVDLVVLLDGAAFTGDIELEELAAALDTLSRRRGLVRLREGWTRHGYTDDDVLHRAVSILSDADRARGREHLPERVRAWHELIRQSLFTPAGRARPARLLGLT